MTNAAFPLDAAILQLAAQGVALDVGTVATRLGCTPDAAEQALDDMARRGVVDLQLDEDSGALSYSPRGLDSMGGQSGPDPLPFTPPTPPRSPRPGAHAYASPAPSRQTTWAPPAPLVPPPMKHSIVGMLWALLIPGFGLLYAAPASVALLAGFLCFSAGELFEAIPLVGDWLSPLVMVACAIGSALLSLVYVKRFNEVGTRAHLDDDIGDQILSRVR